MLLRTFVSQQRGATSGNMTHDCREKNYPDSGNLNKYLDTLFVLSEDHKTIIFMTSSNTGTRT